MKIMKVELLIIDHDSIGEEEIKDVLENTKYPNWCINPEVKSIKTAKVDWHDEHPLNIKSKSDSAYIEIFGLNKQ